MIAKSEWFEQKVVLVFSYLQLVYDSYVKFIVLVVVIIIKISLTSVIGLLDFTTIHPKAFLLSCIYGRRDHVISNNSRLEIDVLISGELQKKKFIEENDDLEIVTPIFTMLYQC